MRNKLIIDLNRVQNNYKKIANFVGDFEKCGVVIKANAYGLGTEMITCGLLQTQVKNIFCFSFDEGIRIRHTAKTFFPKKEINIYVLNGIFKGEAEFFINNDLIPILNNQEQINLWCNVAKKYNTELRAAIQFDTGMNRSGFSYLKAEKISKKIKNTNILNECIKIDYITSHLGCADEPDSPRNQVQRERVEKIRKFFPDVPFSFSASDGTILDANYHYDLNRIGRGLYGPINYRKNSLSLKQVLYVESYVKKIDGNKAVIDFGYNNGYYTNLCNKQDIQKSTFVYCNNQKFFVSAIHENEIEVLLSEDHNIKTNDRIEITGDNVLLDKIGEYSNNIFYTLQISFCSANREIIEYKGLPENFKEKLYKPSKEILDLIKKNQKQIKLNSNGDLEYFTSYIIEKREIFEKDRVGYGAHYGVEPGDHLATLPIGYSDGLMRNLSNKKFYVKCNGKKFETVGNISMNQTTLKIPEGFEDKVKLGDGVIIYDNKDTKKLENLLDMKLEEFCLAISSRNNISLLF